MSNHYNYNQDNHFLVVGGVNLKDFGKDSKFKIAWDTDAKTLQVGVDGATTTSERAERTATITFKVLQASPINLILERLSKLKGFPILYVNADYVGDVGYKGDNAFIPKIADLEIAGDSGEREWTIKVPNMVNTHDVAEDILKGFGGLI